MKKITLICAIFTLFISSCKNDEKLIKFEGITKTDATGSLISKDETDWNFEENWINQENILFTEKKDISCNTGSFAYSIKAFPNPCKDIFFLHISKQETDRFAFRIVNNDFDVLASYDSIYSSGIAINLSEKNVNNSIVRIYYKVFGEDCELKGHGDIQVN
jgi:hypothetical protein